MSTVEVQSLGKEIRLLRREISEIKEAFLSCIKDDEGDYKDSFVKEVLSLAQKRPIYHYNKKDFLKRIG